MDLTERIEPQGMSHTVADWLSATCIDCMAQGNPSRLQNQTKRDMRYNSKNIKHMHGVSRAKKAVRLGVVGTGVGQ